MQMNKDKRMRWDSPANKVAPTTTLERGETLKYDVVKYAKLQTQ